MTIFGVIRHGVTDWNKQLRAQGLQDVPLNAEGILQAEALGRRLAKEEWDYIYTSDLTRASATAEIIAKAMGKQVTGMDARLREKTHGRLDGTTEAERPGLWGENWRDLDHGEESSADVFLRVMDFVDEMTIKYPGKRILLITHGAWIRTMFEQLFKEMELSFLNNTCVNVLQRQDQHWHCLLFNCTKHLEFSTL